jgi:hypothetical protein
MAQTAPAAPRLKVANGMRHARRAVRRRDSAACQFVAPINQLLPTLVWCQQRKFSEQLPHVARVRAIVTAVLLPKVEDLVKGNGREIEADYLQVQRHDVARGRHRRPRERLDQVRDHLAIRRGGMEFQSRPMSRVTGQL